MISSLSLFGCLSNNNKSPSYVIIAIDRLGSGTVSCPEYLERGEGGFFILCNDFVKLSQAYTTSIQSPAAIASILTGEYPINHDLRHADNQLSFNYPLIPQYLIKLGYKTSFFSEGDPVKTYQGLNRGFENFYDFSMTPENLSVTEVFRAAEKFIFKDNKPKFAFIYLSSLVNLSENEVKLNHIETHLESFFYDLKKSNKWHNTHILVVGLQGSLEQSYKSPWPVVDLSERNIKVDAFIKPASKPRDKELSFQINENISLADIGQTLKDWAGSKPLIGSSKRTLPIVTKSKSFNHSLSSLGTSNAKTKIKKTTKDAFLIESSWPDWRFGYAPIYLILDDQYRVFLNKELKIFNTLLNREISINIDEQIPNDRLNFYLSVAAELNSEGKDQFKEIDINKFSLGYQIWGLKNYKYPDILEDLENLRKNEKDDNGEYNNDEEIIDWMAKVAVQNFDCKKLLQLSKIKNNKKWRLAANSCLNVYTKFTKEYRTGCLRAFFKQVKTWSNLCQNDLLYYAWKYINFDKSETELKRFYEVYITNQTKEQKIQYNWKTYLSSSLSNEIAIEPSDFELYYLQLSKDQRKLIDPPKPQL